MGGEREGKERETVTYLIGRLVLDGFADRLLGQGLADLLSLLLLDDFGFDQSLIVLGFGGLRFLGFGVEEIGVEIDFDVHRLGLT